MPTTPARKPAAKKTAARKTTTAARKATVTRAQTAPKPNGKRRTPPPAPPGITKIEVLGGDVVRFKVEETWYEMPDAAAAAARLGGAYFMDVATGEQDGSGDMRMAFAMLDASDIYEATYEVLRRIPIPDLLQVVNTWMASQSDGQPMGESSSS